MAGSLTSGALTGGRVTTFLACSTGGVAFGCGGRVDWAEPDVAAAFALMAGAAKKSSRGVRSCAIRVAPTRSQTGKLYVFIVLRTFSRVKFGLLMVLFGGSRKGVNWCFDLSLPSFY